MSFLSIEHVSKSFSQTAAVEDFTLGIEKGEFVSLLGPSGCGKTTTLRMVAGFETPDSGQVMLDGVDITQKPPNQRKVGMVFQAYALFPNMTVAGNVGFGLRVARRSKEEVEKRVAEMLAMIKMPQLGDRYPYQLSGGQQQRVALARALAIHPQVLLLDEPLSALDAKIRLELRVEIRRIQQELGITTMYVTHDQEEALSLSDRVVVMNAGRTEQVGPPFEIYNFPQTPFVASFVGTLNLLRCKVLDAAKGKLTFDGQTFETRASVKAHPGDQVEVMLRPEGLHVGALPGENHLVGKVQMVNFLGSIVRVRLGLGESLITLDMLNERGSTPPEAGQSLSVSFAPDACWIMIRT